MADIVVPTLGESVTEATIAKWLKGVGEAVAVDEPLVELETDKVTLEVNAESAGVLAEIIAQEGDTVEVGAVLGKLGEGAGAAPAPKKEEPKAAAAVPAPAAQPETDDGPAVRKLLAENNLDPNQIKGTGKDGRLTKGDVLAFLQGGGAAKPAPTAPAPVVSPGGPAITPSKDLPARAENARGEERVKMTKLRKVIAQRLKDAQNTAAMLTTFNEVDMTDLIALRARYKDQFEKKHGIRIGFLSFFAKAVIAALKEIPAVNAEIYGEEIIYKNFYDISIAVGTPQGLVVPVVRDVDVKSFAQIERDIADLAKRARDGKLSMAEMQGGTFTITNGGVYGSLLSTPILNPPQSGILGMHKTMKRPMVMPDGSIQARDMMYIALSYDHRIIDGREAVTFLVRVKEGLEDPERMLLDV